MPDSIDRPPLARNVQRIAHLDIPGGGQIVVDGDHAYIGHMAPPHGTSILDVSDPKNPRVVSTIELEDDYSHTHKVRVNGDIMITNVEMNRRHFLRKGERMAAMSAKLKTVLGRDMTPAELAGALKVKESDLPELEAFNQRGYYEGGFKLWDISDKANPKFLHHERTFGFGTHRFDADERYAYISTEMEGYIGNILVIYDIGDPTNPLEVSRWWMPGQHLAGGETPTWHGYGNRLHHAMKVGDELWAAVWHAGFRVLDISDIANPVMIGSHNYHPPVLDPSHTIMPLPKTNDGRRIAVGIDEEHDHVHGQPHACLWVFDVSDPMKFKTLSSFHVSEMDSPWSRTPGGRFGAHQFREKMDGTLIYATWFSGGLRIVDVKKPELPVEVGYFIPEPVGDSPCPASNDVDVDGRGLIYLLDRVNGLDILEFDG
ncbi:MAG: RNA polymerase subunit sigma-70 [Alphaproteobacteria bacterium]|nr:RNA polymerase subunit sigma-70 [Alphaproteobacteria bacterium]